MIYNQNDIYDTLLQTDTDSFECVFCSTKTNLNGAKQKCLNCKRKNCFQYSNLRDQLEKTFKGKLIVLERKYVFIVRKDSMKELMQCSKCSLWVQKNNKVKTDKNNPCPYCLKRKKTLMQNKNSFQNFEDSTFGVL